VVTLGAGADLAGSDVFGTGGSAGGFGCSCRQPKAVNANDNSATDAVRVEIMFYSS
jgi:hypothetical protein